MQAIKLTIKDLRFLVRYKRIYKTRRTLALQCYDLDKAVRRLKRSILRALKINFKNL